jgi:ribosomal protein S6
LEWIIKADMNLTLIYEGYEIYKDSTGHYEIGYKIGPKGKRTTSLTGTSSKLLSVLKFLIMKKEWDKK